MWSISLRLLHINYKSGRFISLIKWITRKCEKIVNGFIIINIIDPPFLSIRSTEKRTQWNSLCLGATKELLFYTTSIKSITDLLIYCDHLSRIKITILNWQYPPRDRPQTQLVSQSVHLSETWTLDNNNWITSHSLSTQTPHTDW